MSAVTTAARAYLAARKAHQEAKAITLVCERHLHAAEKDLTDAIMNAPSEDGTAIVVDRVVLLLPEESWERAPGKRIEVHLLVPDA